MYEEYLKGFTELYNQLSCIYDNVFYDFVKICAISIYNSFAKNESMEQDYLNTINSYKKEHINMLVKMFHELIMMYEKSTDIKDILGPFYENKHLNNHNLGQFFTPSHISDLMSNVIIEDGNIIKEKIKKNGFITLSEPTCGAGGIILSFAKSLYNQHINYQKDLLVEATDISDICAYMTYIQLSLYGIPAVVYCGDSLSQKFKFQMETPLFYLQYWKFKKFYEQSDSKNLSQHNNKELITNSNLFKEVNIKGNFQISLW